MRNSASFLVEPTDVPSRRMNETNGFIPALDLESPYGSIALLFRPGRSEQTIAYLTALAAEATALAEEIKARQVES